MIEIHRDQHFTSPIFDGWSSWNNQLDAYTKKNVQRAIRGLPNIAQQVIDETDLMQAQVMMDSLGKATWLQCIGSPWLAGTLGVLGVIATAKLFCRYVHPHIRSVSALLSRNRDGCIVVPILLIEIISIYQIVFYPPNQVVENISVSLWCISIAGLANAAFHAMEL